jgi:anti-sigma factor RsiW
VSHLGELVSALVDGELSGAELDRANAHLAACGACQAEANSFRELKLELRALAGSADPEGLTRRLLALPDAGSAVTAVRTSQPGPGYDPRRRLAREPAGEDALAAPYAAGPRGAATGRRRGRYLLWSTVSLVVVGIGGAAFGMGGANTGSTEPRITPQYEVFDVEHAVTSGDVPYADPADVFARVPAVAATP